jgi:hypothetical protein
MKCYRNVTSFSPTLHQLPLYHCTNNQKMTKTRVKLKPGATSPVAKQYGDQRTNRWTDRRIKSLKKILYLIVSLLDQKSVETFLGARLNVLYLLYCILQFCIFCTYCIVLYLFLFSTRHYSKCCTIQYICISQGKTRCQTLKGHNLETVHLFELKFFVEMYFSQLYQRFTREVLEIDQSIAIVTLRV